MHDGGWKVITDATLEQRIALVEETWSDPLFGELPPLPGAVQFIHSVRERMQIVYSTTVTTIPGIESRLRNLRALDLLDDSMVIKFEHTAYDKAETVKLAQPMFFIDDKPKNLSIVMDKNPGVGTIWFNSEERLLWPEEYKVEPHYQYTSWDDAKIHLLKLIT